MPDKPPLIDTHARRPAWLALFAIALIAGTIAFAFAWVAGWLSPDRLTPERFVDAIEKGNGEVYPGFRRAHAKGVCIAGYFEGNGEGAALSSTRMFEKVRSPFVGRMSVGGGSPYGLDNKARVRSMALELRSDDGQQWRMAMNSFPFFGVSSVEAFYEQTRANAPDPQPANLILQSRLHLPRRIRSSSVLPRGPRTHPGRPAGPARPTTASTRSASSTQREMVAMCAGRCSPAPHSW